MKRFLCELCSAAVLVQTVLLSSCGRLGEDSIQGTGKLCVSFVKGGELYTRSSLNIPDTSDFLLDIKSSSGETIYDGKYGDCPEILEVTPGSYNIRVVSTEFLKPAFEQPQFGDEQCVIVQDGGTAGVRLQCRQMNAGVRLVISPDFLTNCPDASLLLKSETGKLMYSYREKRTAYFHPGPVSLVMTTGTVDEVIFVRDLAESEMLTLGVSVSPSVQGSDSGISMSIDTSRVWVNDECIIGTGNSGMGADDALSVSDARNSSGLEDVWVCGYIVGGDLTSSSASFKSPFKSKTNLLLGPRSSTVDRKSCISVQLPDGEVREALNLVDNPELYRRRVMVRGNVVDAYYGIPGIKGTTDYQLL